MPKLFKKFTGAYLTPAGPGAGGGQGRWPMVSGLQARSPGAEMVSGLQAVQEPRGLRRGPWTAWSPLSHRPSVLGGSTPAPKSPLHKRTPRACYCLSGREGGLSEPRARLVKNPRNSPLLKYSKISPCTLCLD